MSITNYSHLRAGGVTAEKWKALVDTVQRNELTQGSNYTLLQTPNGTTIRPKGKGVASAGAPCPFTIKLTPASGTTLHVTLSPGTVNNLLPTNIFDADDVSISTTGTYYIKLHCLTSGANVTSVSVTGSTSAPSAFTAAENAPPTTVDILLYVIVDSVPFRVLECGSIMLVPKLMLAVEKAAPEEGESLFVMKYAWGINDIVEPGGEA